ncbi:MAG: recombination protein RecR [Bacteroidetes bacterium]|nr:MAG: recombination protein RecR [Bacteroidota bacterium]
MLQENQYSSKLLNNAVAEFSKLPGIGNKTALRLVLHLLKKSEEDVSLFGETIIELRKNIKKCKVCKNVSDNEICEICADSSRDNKIVCLVENINDVIAIERTGQYRGLYHVLGGLISPMDGIGPDNLEINSLIDRLKSSETKELIFALNATPEGETTNFYTFKKVSGLGVKITTLAKGVSVGSELQYVDELTLGRSITDRIQFFQ